MFRNCQYFNEALHSIKNFKALLQQHLGVCPTWKGWGTWDTAHQPLFYVEDDV